jgi:hypothetical protein
MPNKELKVVSVAWVDSASHPYWQDADEKWDILRCHSVGFLIEENEYLVAIAQSAGLDGDAKPWADVIVIPKCSISVMQTIKEYVKEVVVKEVGNA